MALLAATVTGVVSIVEGATGAEATPDLQTEGAFEDTHVTGTLHRRAITMMGLTTTSKSLSSPQIRTSMGGLGKTRGF